jgi:signal transduction histidine kinase/ActR/RegA family two-component response regulator
MAEVVGGGRPEVRDAEVLIERPDGSRVTVIVNIVSLKNDRKEVTGAINCFYDITERKHAEEALDLARKQAETANRSKDRFLAVLSHELRTPLTPVLARLALMKRDPSLASSLRGGLEVIRRNVEMEARLIDDLLDMTRLARGQLKLQMERVDVHDKIHAALAIYECDLNARKQTISVELRAENHFVRGDGVRLQQIFWNLIGNAVKYTAEGGHIAVRSENIAGEGEGSVRIEVSDDGIGIAPDVMGRIFDPFEQGEQTLTRRYGGLGLGLSISRSLVERHGGTLVAHSNGKGTGSTFTVQLAAASAPKDEPCDAPIREIKSAAAEPAGTSAHLEHHRILLVDDNLDTLRVMARLLRMNGHQVITADSVTSALAEGRERIDLLITDIGLPDGTGWELMRQLCQRGLRRGIAISGFSTDEDYRRSRDAGFGEHLCKPINPEDLEQAIQRAWGEVRENADAPVRI